MKVNINYNLAILEFDVIGRDVAVSPFMTNSVILFIYDYFLRAEVQVAIFSINHDFIANKAS